MSLLALLKELLDNALDECENANRAPEITVTVWPDSLSVADNGRGLPLHTLERSLDYSVRVSDKRLYVSPSRGQHGNALSTIWAAPCVRDGQHGRVLVETARAFLRNDPGGSWFAWRRSLCTKAKREAPAWSGS